jgi:hypothetical protein
MALFPINMPSFPAVPNLPGVPALLRQVGAVLPIQVTAIADALGLSSIFPPAWGILDENGTPVLVGDAVAGIDFHQEFRVSDFPIEEGGFSSYNKVQTPFSVRIGFSVGGSDSARSEFHSKVQAAVSSLKTYTVVSPEVVYLGVNLTRWSYRRDDRRGAGLLNIDIWCEEIRIAASPSFSKATQSASSQDPSDQGVVQPETPSASESGASGMAAGPV